jgi:pimeloyl-ACP methyl ester carboxylesterase
MVFEWYKECFDCLRDAVAVDLRRALSTEPKPPGPEYCSGPRAWADGSGWKGVYDILVKDGYHVSIVQEPETSFKEHVAATKRVLAQQDGPCILVAHSYGGAVITEAGTDPSVAGLVYIAAHMPDAGENEADDGKRFPSDLSKSTAIKKTADGFTYLDPAQFHEYFAADLSAEQAAFMARSQVLNAADDSTPAGCWVVVADTTG